MAELSELLRTTDDFLYHDGDFDRLYDVAVRYLPHAIDPLGRDRGANLAVLVVRLEAQLDAGEIDMAGLRSELSVFVSRYFSRMTTNTTVSETSTFLIVTSSLPQAERLPDTPPWWPIGDPVSEEDFVLT